MAERQCELGIGIGMHDPIDDNEVVAAALQQAAAEQQRAGVEDVHQRELALQAPLSSPPRGPQVGNNHPQRRVTLGEQDAPHANYMNRSTITMLAIQRQDYDIKPQIIVLVEQN